MNALKNVLVAGLLGLGTLTVGCADNDARITIVGVMAPGSPPDCVLTPAADSTTSGKGILDLAFTGSYTAPLLIANQLKQQGDAALARQESSIVLLNRAEVTLTNVRGEQLRDPFTLVGAGTIYESVSNAQSYGIFFATLVPDAATILTRAGTPTTTVIAKVRVFGRSLGEKDIESNLFEWPVTICNGCLIKNDCGTNEDLKWCEAGRDVEVTCKALPTPAP